MRAGKDAAVEFGQDDMHGEVGRRKAALAVLPGVAPGRCDETWKTGTPIRSNSVSVPGSAPLAKAVAVTIAAGDRSAAACSTKATTAGSFRLDDEDRHGGRCLVPFSACASASIGATSAASSIER